MPAGRARRVGVLARSAVLRLLVQWHTLRCCTVARPAVAVNAATRPNAKLAAPRGLHPVHSTRYGRQRMKISSCKKQIVDPDQALRNPPNTSTTKPRDRATRPLRGCFARRVTRVTCADRGRATVSELDFAKPTPKTVWPSGRRRWLEAPVRKGVGSNPTAVTLRDWRVCARGPGP